MFHRNTFSSQWFIPRLNSALIEKTNLGIWAFWDAQVRFRFSMHSSNAIEIGFAKKSFKISTFSDLFWGDARCQIEPPLANLNGAKRKPILARGRKTAFEIFAKKYVVVRRWDKNIDKMPFFAAFYGGPWGWNCELWQLGFYWTDWTKILAVSPSWRKELQKESIHSQNDSFINIFGFSNTISFSTSLFESLAISSKYVSYVQCSF